ncbi:FAD-dependent monooxygenase [Krasilnikovia sp. MM14-A1259]|uniref:FAD-dependent monooxygenase n=1 Tax=Krasilnikovia sp. MM14-A1259 TaxID=3373539 RepID=UPI003815D5A1
MRAAGEVLVVGAGPTGLAAAVELLRRDVAVRIVDRSTRRNPHSKAIVLWPRALDVFARLGAADRIREMAVPITAANYYSGRRRVARINFRQLAGSRWSTPLSLPQNDTEQVLRDVLDEVGGAVEYGHRLVGITQDASGALARFAAPDDEPREHRSDWALGCDGAHSTVRTSLGVGFTGSAYEQAYVLADGYWDTPLLHEESYYFMGPTGVLVVVGLPGGKVRVFGSAPADAAGESAEETVRRIAAERSPVPLRLAESAGSGTFQIQRRIADRFRNGRVLLAGDAAHVHSPAGGQGLNTSVQDAYEAAWRLADVIHGRLPDHELDQWERERRHVAQFVVRDTDRQTRLWTQGGWQRHLRNVALRTAQATGALDRLAPPRLAQLSLAYPASGGGLGRLVPGTRVPDVRLPIGGRLHDLLSTGGRTLLLTEDAEHRFDRAWAARHGVHVVPVDRALARVLGLRGRGAVLVRPDAVVAVAGRFTDSTLVSRIERALPPVATHPDLKESA